jgi:hypothetical protein
MLKNSTDTSQALFAVVGHPNKGKSSIVATLSQNDSIAISAKSGTTVSADIYSVNTNTSGYSLFDTPGFQRPKRVLAWLKQRASSADKRAQAVVDFINDPDCQKQFPDEVELLTPLVNGAAILYVVDGSRPYGSEYEVEMEILRWTGQPSMALINPIENHSHIESWQNALSQYFKTVRVFNPMQAEFEKQLELLSVFTHLKPQWADSLNRVIEELGLRRQSQIDESAKLLADLLEDLCFYKQKQKVLTKSQGQSLQSLLVKQYQSWMSKREKQAIKALFTNYAHYQTQLTMDDLILPPDLFDCEQWYAWGLNKKQLISVAAATGATAGAAVDLAVAGHSFMLGAIGGGIFGASSAWFGAHKLVDAKLKGLPLGGYEAVYGPIKNKNFTYVVIARFIYLYRQISQRSHAVRASLEIQSECLQQQIEQLEKNEQKALHHACAKLIKQQPVEDLSSILRRLF